jgi:tuftelin-interacting protein 11
VRDNILDQLILPKVSSAIAEWSPSAAKRETAPQLHTLVFPWLEHAGERMEMVMDESKRKIRAWLKAWKARDGVPKGLAAWRDVSLSLSLSPVLDQFVYHALTLCF